MRQRVGIARALAVRPAILLMDEPLSALDSQTRELLMEDFIRLLADGAMGAVYVTHNLEEAVRLADRIVVLSRRPGRLREVVTIPMTRDQVCAAVEETINASGFKEAYIRLIVSRGVGPYYGPKPELLRHNDRK